MGFREFKKKQDEESSRPQDLLIEQLKSEDRADDAKTNELMNTYMMSLMQGDKEPSVEELTQMYMLFQDYQQ